jgi:hypothetical protein
MDAQERSLQNWRLLYRNRRSIPVSWRVRRNAAPSQQQTPNSSHTSQAEQGRAKVSAQDKMPVERRTAMTRAQRFKRVFTNSSRLGDIDVEICSRCGGAVKVIADTSDRCIEDQQVIDKILFHLKKKDGYPYRPMLCQKPEHRLSNSRRHEANQFAWLTSE